MRVGGQAALRISDSYLFEQADRTCARLRMRQAEVQSQGFGELVFDGEARIQAGNRILKNHGHIPPHHAAALLGIQAQQIVAIESHRACLNPPGKGNQAHQGQHADAFAGAGLAHHSQHLTRLQLDMDIFHRFQNALARRKFNSQTFDF